VKGGPTGRPGLEAGSVTDFPGLLLMSPKIHKSQVVIYLAAWYCLVKLSDNVLLNAASLYRKAHTSGACSFWQT